MCVAFRIKWHALETDDIFHKQDAVTFTFQTRLLYASMNGKTPQTGLLYSSQCKLLQTACVDFHLFRWTFGHDIVSLEWDRFQRLNDTRPIIRGFYNRFYAKQLKKYQVNFNSNLKRTVQ
jgi:hypothetical protein